ncbi:hypothetical protein Tco_0110141 [Tanacetum coccineum]
MMCWICGVVYYKGIDARVVVEAVDREETETGARGPVEGRVDRVTQPRFHDYTEEIPVHCVQTIESVQRDQGHRIVAIGQQSADMLDRIRELEQDNIILRDMIDVASQRVTQTMPNTRSGASRTREGINEQIDRRLVGALGAHDAARNLKPLIGGGGEQEEISRNGENGNGNGNGGGNGYNFGVTEHLMARSGTDLKMAKLLMSSPNHPTSEIDDAFSSNFPNYISASPDYVPTSPGKT